MKIWSEPLVDKDNDVVGLLENSHSASLLSSVLCMSGERCYY